jgi:hypothetical protein
MLAAIKLVTEGSAGSIANRGETDTASAAVAA